MDYVELHGEAFDGGLPIREATKCGFGPLYLSHMLSTFGDRMWQFAIPILFIDLWTETIFPCSLFVFVNNLAKFLLLPYIGAWSDRHHRLTVMKLAIIVQNVSIVLCTLVLFMLVYFTEETRQSTDDILNLREFIAFSGVTVFSVIGELFGVCGTNILERDWIVVMSGDDKRTLSIVNSQMRRIDLCSKVSAPLIYSIVLQCFSEYRSASRLYIGVAVVGIWNLISLPIEYITISSTYRANKWKLDQQSPSSKAQRTTKIHDLIVGWRSYISHRVFFASFAYSMLYMTVLDNGTLMIAYLNYVSIPKLLLGITRGAGAAVGLIGTLFYPCFLRKVGCLSKTGAIAISVFALCLIPISVCFALQLVDPELLVLDGITITPYIMIFAVVISRVWLWTFDLAEGQILQELIVEGQRGLINSVETAMCQVFLVILSILGMVFSDPKRFQYLVYLTNFNVVVAAVLFAYWSWRNPIHGTF